VTQVSNGFSLIPPQEKSVSPRDKWCFSFNRNWVISPHCKEVFCQRYINERGCSCVTDGLSCNHSALYCNRTLRQNSFLGTFLHPLHSRPLVPIISSSCRCVALL
jgi:hypothetical protein